MRLGMGLAAAVLTISPVAGADAVESRESGLDVAASEADDGKTISIPPGREFLVALRVRPGSDCFWRVLQFDSAVLEGLERPQVRFEPRPDPSAVGFLSSETFRFRAVRSGETGLAFGFFHRYEPTPPEKQVRILIRTG
jgi:predicted secreted protein